MKKIKKTIKFCDIFGSSITFRHNNQLKFKTLGGGIATIFSMAFLIFLFNYFADDCINKTNPLVRDNNVYQIDNYINMTNYFWAFYFTDGFKNKIEDPQRYVAFHAIHTNWDQTMKITPIKFSKCNINKHFKRIKLDREKIFQIIPNLYDSFCLDLDDDFFLLNGNTQIPRSSLDIFVIECENKTMKDINCIYY